MLVISLKERLLAFMHADAYKPLKDEELINALALEGKDITEFFALLRTLEHSCEIIRSRAGKYNTPEKLNLFIGTFCASTKGYGFVSEETSHLGDIFIPPDVTLNAMHGDKVMGRINKSTQNIEGKRREGEITKIIERKNQNIVGTFDPSPNFGFVTADDKRIVNDIFIAKQHFNGAKKGDKVIVDILKWPESKKSAEGKIIKILGAESDKGIEILSTIIRHNLPIDFPEEVLKEAEGIAQEVGQEETKGRRDLRHLPIVTIDGEDAKDLDDAVYVKNLQNGTYLLGVYIADVSYYVKENSPLDKEARARGTSVYLVDRVIPMLPKPLSNGICSLNAKVDRMALAIEMKIDDKGQIIDYEIFEALINVHTRLSYNIVRKVLTNEDDALKEEHQELLPMFKEMEELCLILKARRRRRGAIDFDFPEIKIKLDDKGQPIEVVQRIRTISESIIEEFMLAANETVAEHIYHLGIPGIYRIHENPDSEKMARLNQLLYNFGIKLPRIEEVHPMILQKVLDSVADRPEERIISAVMLRSLKQARYSVENVGHFGLAARYYTHFTSPIRRYPDLIVHRLLRETITGKALTAKRIDKLAEILPQIALNSSERERAAELAERETLDIKKVEYMAKFVGEEFEGIISGVTAFGIFVEMSNGIEGLVHVSFLDDDYYIYMEEQFALIGERTKHTYRLGDNVKVKVTNANIGERNIDLKIAEGFKPKKGLEILKTLPEKTKKNNDILLGGNKDTKNIKGKGQINKGKSKKNKNTKDKGKPKSKNKTKELTSKKTTKPVASKDILTTIE